MNSPATYLFVFCRFNLEKNIEKFDKWADKFERLPLYFMTFHGQHTLKTVLEVRENIVATMKP